MITASCIHCKKEYSIKGIFTHFLQSHDSKWKEEWKDKNQGNSTLGNLVQIKNKNKRIQSYEANPNYCFCGNSKSWKRKNNIYCSKSCAARHTNKKRGPHSDEFKQKISNSLKGKPSKFKGISGGNKTFCSVYFHKCSQCETIILSRGSYPKRKTCSKVCQTHASVGVRKYINGRRLNIYYKKKNESIVLLESSWEEILAKHLDAEDIEWERPKPIKYLQNNKTRLYYPDFFLPLYNLYLDPKNPYELNRSKEKMSIVSSLIPLWYGDITKIIESIPLVRAVGFEPTTRMFAPAPKAGGMNQTIRRSD